MATHCVLNVRGEFVALKLKASPIYNKSLWALTLLLSMSIQMMGLSILGKIDSRLRQAKAYIWISYLEEWHCCYVVISLSSACLTPIYEKKRVIGLDM
jgi:hypothetical protein